MKGFEISKAMKGEPTIMPTMPNVLNGNPQEIKIIAMTRTNEMIIEIQIAGVTYFRGFVDSSRDSEIKFMT